MRSNLLNWREVREADLPQCLNIEPRNIGDEIVGRERAIEVWNGLLRTRAFGSCVVEVEGRIVAFGASVFVTREFATQEIADPRPGLNSRLIAAVANGQPVVRPQSDLYDTAPEDELDLMTLYGNWRADGLSEGQFRDAVMQLPMSYIELHTGYRLGRLFGEPVGAEQCGFVESAGVWRVTKQFPESEQTFVVMSREDAFSVSGSIAPTLFQYRAPLLGLRDSEKHLLVEALTRRSDSELAEAMNLSPPTIKKRWQALFEKIADVHPDLFLGADDKASSGSRGPQKRHHILAYVRSHPQELRPYRWRAFKEA